MEAKPPRAIAVASWTENGIKKEGIAEFDVLFKNGKTYAVMGPVLRNGLVPIRELIPSRLLKKDAPYDYFYMASLNLDPERN